MKNKFIPVETSNDTLTDYQGTPIEKFLLFHNLGEDVPVNSNPNLLICTCVDFRITLKITHRFAYVLRIAGANANYLEFLIAFAVSVMGIKSIAVIGRDDCAMTNLSAKRQPFFDGMDKNAG